MESDEEQREATKGTHIIHVDVKDMSNESAITLLIVAWRITSKEAERTRRTSDFQEIFPQTHTAQQPQKFFSRDTNQFYYCLSNQTSWIYRNKTQQPHKRIE